jgi:dTDP-4-amino-4,6-dideoxygalactose transaminase
LSARTFGRLAPGGRGIPLRVLIALFAIDDPAARLDAILRARFPGFTPTFHASGREAMRFAFATLAARSGRSEVALPAYCCYSLAASAVAAGLRIRLVDVDVHGGLDPGALARTPLEGVAAVVVGNHFGLPEPIGPIREAIAAAGVAVIDDAAQAIGAKTNEGEVGGRGDVGVLSFGRGKPVSALGGGALLWRGDRLPIDPPPSPTVGSRERVEALVRAVAYDVARHPFVLRALAAIPALEIGQTRYDPDFRRGAIAGSAALLAAALFPELDGAVADHRRRGEALAARIRAATAFEPLAARGAEGASHSRLALRAPDRASRERALASLTGWGATGMYPASLAQVDALRPHLVGDTACPGARDLAERLLTLPTHPGLSESGVDQVVARLGSVAGRSG